MAPSRNASTLVDHFFRKEFGKAVSFLTGRFGPVYLNEAEDAVHEALLKAMQTWPLGKPPDDPTAWIIRVAGNKLIDQIRRKQKVYYTTRVPDMKVQQADITDDYFQDEVIKMMFACCSPKLRVEYQLVLTLRLLGGLSIKEIASALMKKEEAVAKSLTRAKKKFREENVNLQLPSKNEIQMRLQVVLKVIYLLFNEGYKATEGNQLIRRDLCEEAMRLNHLLLEKEETNNDWTRSLMALMHFQVSRFESRTDQEGEIISLEYQDRSAWDRRHIDLGNRYLNLVTDGLYNHYFLQAAICGIYANAETYESTQWIYILKLYDYLYAIHPNPLILLNRIIPLSKVEGEAKALVHLEELEHDEILKNSYLLPAIKAELYVGLKNQDLARQQLQKAIELTRNQKEKRFLMRKLKVFLDT